MSEVKRYYVGINTKCIGGIGLVEMTDLYREATGFDGLVMGKDYDALKAENESLRRLALELRSSVECGNVDHCKAEQYELGEPCKVLARIDAVLGLKVKP